jgi:hypothetical protein
MELIEHNLLAWLVATLITVLTIFSDRLLGRVRFQLNKADLRVKYFEKLAVDLSTNLFYAAIFEERFRRGWTDDKEDIAAVAGEVNAAITRLLTKEYVYRSWATKYWGRAAAAELVTIFANVKAVDDAIHEFNSAGQQEAKVAKLRSELDRARAGVDKWLSSNDA